MAQDGNVIRLNVHLRKQREEERLTRIDGGERGLAAAVVVVGKSGERGAWRWIGK